MVRPAFVTSEMYKTTRVFTGVSGIHSSSPDACGHWVAAETSLRGYILG